MRCPQHFQGDRCKKERGHESTLAANLDPTHIGNWSAWIGEGDSKKQVARFQPKAPARNRQVNRLANTKHFADQNVGKALLTEVIKHLRGGR